MKGIQCLEIYMNTPIPTLIDVMQAEEDASEALLNLLPPNENKIVTSLKASSAPGNLIIHLLDLKKIVSMRPFVIKELCRVLKQR